ncbi:RDD family protein, partial [Cellulomonas shaoxiangyii]
MTHRTGALPRDVDVTDTPASLGRRFLAVAVDQLLVALLLAPFTLDALRRVLATARAADPGDVVVAPVGVGALVALVLAAAVAATQWVLHGRLGWTLGRRLLGVRTVDVHSRRPVGLVRVLLRELVVAAGALACLVGQVAVLVSPALDRTGRNRGWHDRAVDAEVLLAQDGAVAVRARTGTTASHTSMLPVSGPLSAGDPGGAPGTAAAVAPDAAAPSSADAPAAPAAPAAASAPSGPGAAARPAWAALADPAASAPGAAS